ncbi:MAG: serine/threonine protein kinase, partial [Mycobacterium sp.]
MRIVTDFNGLTYYEVDFNSDGTLDTAGGAGDGGLPAAVAAGGINDLFVFSHGWNSGVDSARDLYQAMFGLLANQLGGHLSSSAAVGIIWPSLLFPDDDPDTAPPVPSTGGELAAALTPAFPGQQQQLATMGQLLDQQPQDPAKLTQFHQLAAGLVTTPAQGVEDTGEAALLTADTATAFGHAAAMA